MRSSILPRLAAFTLLAAAPLAAQSTTSGSARPTFGVFGGAAFPTGDFGDGFDTGYNVGAFVGFRPASVPVGLRIDGAYNRFDVKSGLVNVDAHTNVLSGTANVVLQGTSSPGMVRPYAIGGLGIYNSKLVTDVGNSDSETKFGVNAGAGLDIALSGIAVFVEARYNYVFTKDNDVPGSGNTGYIPVVVGIRF